MRAAGERLDVQRLRVLPVDPVADAAQQREVAQVLLRGGSAGHPRDRGTSLRGCRRPAAREPWGSRASPDVTGAPERGQHVVAELALSRQPRSALAKHPLRANSPGCLLPRRPCATARLSKRVVPPATTGPRSQRLRPTASGARRSEALNRGPSNSMPQKEPTVGPDARESRHARGRLDDPRETPFDIALSVIPCAVRLAAGDQPGEQLGARRPGTLPQERRERHEPRHGRTLAGSPPGYAARCSAPHRARPWGRAAPRNRNGRVWKSRLCRPSGGGNKFPDDAQGGEAVHGATRVDQRTGGLERVLATGDVTADPRKAPLLQLLEMIVHARTLHANPVVRGGIDGNAPAQRPNFGIFARYIRERNCGSSRPCGPGRLAARSQARSECAADMELSRSICCVAMSLTGQVLRIHEELYKRTDGRFGHRMIGVPTLLLRTTGRRSGAIRTNAMVYARDDDDYLVVASNGGADRPPAWLYNLKARPDVEIQIGRERRPASARIVEASDPGYERLWKLVNANNRDRYTAYQQQTTRRIPVIAITPS